MEVDKTEQSEKAGQPDKVERIWVHLGDAKVEFPESLWTFHSAYLKNAIQDARSRQMNQPTPDEKTAPIRVHLPFKHPAETLIKIAPILQYIGTSADKGQPNKTCSYPTLTEFFQGDADIVRLLETAFPPQTQDANRAMDAKTKRAQPKEHEDLIHNRFIIDALHLAESLNMSALLRILSAYFAFCHNKFRNITAHLAV
jgi:hypothetical protein